MGSRADNCFDQTLFINNNNHYNSANTCYCCNVGDNNNDDGDDDDRGECFCFHCSILELYII